MTTTVTSGIAVIGIPADWPPRARYVGRAQVAYLAPSKVPAVISRSVVTWRYLPGRRIKHALRVDGTSHEHVAVCGISPGWPTTDEQWWGTGSQAEYELVGQVPECKRCASRLSPQTVNA